MSIILFILGVVIMVLAVGLSIGLHEVGHLVPAKLFGVRVPQYMIGFGKTLWSFKRGDTEYGFKAIPLGGYISMIGMYPPAKNKGEVGTTDVPVLRKSSTGMFQQMADEARNAAAEQLQPGDENRMFYKLPVYKRIIIMFGGPVMNLIIGIVMIGIVTVGFGAPAQTSTIAEVYQCVVPLGQEGQRDSAVNNGCKDSDAPGPAYAAGLRPGDIITSFNGQPVGKTEWMGLTQAIRSHAGESVPLTYERDGVSHSTTITPYKTERPVLDAEGRAVVKSDGTPKPLPLASSAWVRRSRTSRNRSPMCSCRGNPDPGCGQRGARPSGPRGRRGPRGVLRRPTRPERSDLGGGRWTHRR